MLQEADLDLLQSTLESEILQAGSSRDRSAATSHPPAAPTTLLSLYGRILSEVCHNVALLESDFHLRSSALLALTKMMAIDRDYCENNMLVLQACFEPYFDLQGAADKGCVDVSIRCINSEAFARCFAGHSDLLCVCWYF